MIRYCCLISLLFLLSLYAEANVIKGLVTDKRTGEPLTGATIRLDPVGLTGMSGLDGSFLLKNIPDGTYILRGSFVSFHAFTREVQLSKGNILILNIALEEDMGTLHEVTIEAVREGYSDATARQIERESHQVMNVLSGRSIQVSPDLTVANAIQRISGVSLERNSNGDGQHAILRGMDKRYNYTLVNGVKIPSPDNSYRYIPLDIFPSELLDRLEVFKSLTPDMEGDAVGGVINMVMKDAPARKMLSVNASTGYSQLFMDREFMSFRHSQVDRQSPFERYGREHTTTPEDFSDVTSIYNTAYPAPNLLTGFALGNRFMDNKLGVIAAASFHNTYRGSNSIFFEERREQDVQAATLTDLNRREFSEQQTRAGIHTKMDYRMGQSHKIQWYNAYMYFGNAQIRDIASIGLQYGGYDPDLGNATMSFETRSRVTKQSIFNSTLQGEHNINARLSTDWSLIFSKAGNAQPDNTTISLVGEMRDFDVRRTYASGGRRRWERNTDQDWNIFVNVNYQSELIGWPIQWKVGGMYRDKKRSNFFNEHIMRTPSPQPLYGQDFETYDQIDWRFGGASYASPLTYDAVEKIAAAYLQFNWTLDKLEAVGGIRAENTQQGYEMIYVSTLPDGEQRYTDLLPSLNLRYKLTPSNNLRASYFRSINRPGFFEIVPYSIVNEDFNERGNPDLMRAVADNFDLRYELFPSGNEQLMVGIFHKYIQDPIEYTLQADAIRGQDIFYSPGNFGNASNQGFEADFMKYFHKIGIRANYTYTHSSITTEKSKRIRNEQGDFELINVQQTRPLYGQSAHIVNLSALFKDSEKGWDAQVTANYTGKRIFMVAQFVDADYWQRGFLQLDAALEKKIKRQYIVFAKAANLLNTPMEVYQYGNPTNERRIDYQEKNGTTLIQRDFYQRSFLLGVRFEL